VHIPDGFINAQTSLGAGMAALGGVGVALRRSAHTLEDRLVPLAGLVAAFVFAAQMLNFPIAAGTSGHLIGGVLAAILVGPWTAVLCMAIVVFVQALFADGGLTAIGLNVVNLAVVSTLGGYAIFLGCRKLLPAGIWGLSSAGGIAAGASVLLAASAFVVEFALGGPGDVSLRSVSVAMLGVHALIAVGEGAITAAALRLILGARPDLVHGAGAVDPRGMSAPASATAGAG
jgi:cobalt/nickel transport system permease protein